MLAFAWIWHAYLLILLLSVCHDGGSSSQLHSQDRFELVAVNDSYLSQWYDPLGLCMLKTATSSSISYTQYLEISSSFQV